MKIAFIGLGAMGKGMALNLLKSGAELTVFSAHGKSFDAFDAAGVRTSMNIAEAAAADIIFLSLPDGKVVRSVVLGENGLLAALSEGQILVDLGTSDYESTLEIAGKCREKNVGYLDAPVSGLQARAENGTLTVMCGGDEAVFAKVKPYLDCFGSKVLYMGASGSGQLMKLVNQILYDINAAALAEVLPMAVKLGLDPEKVGEVINSGTGRSQASEYFIPRDLAGIFDDSYPMEKAYKDLVSAAEISARERIPMPVLGAATAVYQTALLRGFGKDSKGAMLKVYEELLGVEFRK